MQTEQIRPTKTVLKKKAAKKKGQRTQVQAKATLNPTQTVELSNNTSSVFTVEGNLDFGDKLPHPLNRALENGLKFKAIACMKSEEGTNKWVSCLIEFEGKKITKFIAGIENMRGIAMDSAKIDFMDHIIDAEF